MIADPGEEPSGWEAALFDVAEGADHAAPVTPWTTIPRSGTHLMVPAGRMYVQVGVRPAGVDDPARIGFGSTLERRPCDMVSVTCAGLPQRSPVLEAPGA